MYNTIKEYYDNITCFKTLICGKERTKIKDNNFFPPPYPFVGNKYSTPVIDGERISKVYILSVNQNLESIYDDMTKDKARNSLYPTDFQSLKGHWYGPLNLSISLCNILFGIFLYGKYKFISNKQIIENISYGNCVRCGNPIARSGKPTSAMKKNCMEHTKFDIELLLPDYIFCIGRDPFYQVANCYDHKWIIDDFYYQLDINNKKIKVIYFYHYGIQQSVNTGAKMIKLLSNFNDNAKNLVNDIDQTTNSMDDVWRQAYTDFSKYYASQIIKHAIKC